MSDIPSTDHGSDRYDYIEIQAPDDIPPPAWLTADYMPCPDCRANVFLRWADEQWHVTIAHDDSCPSLAERERS